MLTIHQEPIIQQIHEEFLDKLGIRLCIKREDLLHTFVSGNKWRKLKYNLIEAHEKGHDTLLTFGGAYSNHIYATAAAAKEAGFKSIGIIRGEEHLPLNPTLDFAGKNGMVLHYMDRSTYREKASQDVLNQLKNKFGRFYLIPEGGTNLLAIKGASEIITENVKKFDYLCTSVGTGGTLAGMIKGMRGSRNIIGFSALKGDFLTSEVQHLLQLADAHHLDNWQINSEYHFGGYAKVKQELMEFMKDFEEKHQLLLDPIYTAKMMFGLFDMIKKGHFKERTSILVIHTGGLQGRAGFNI